jgi:hypothetical protein
VGLRTTPNDDIWKVGYRQLSTFSEWHSLGLSDFGRSQVAGQGAIAAAVLGTGVNCLSRGHCSQIPSRVTESLNTFNEACLRARQQ